MGWLSWSILILPGVALVVGGAGVVSAISRQGADLTLRLGRIAARLTAAGLIATLALAGVDFWLTLRDAGHLVNPADKATIASAAISEALNCGAAGVLYSLPPATLSVACWLLSRAKRARSTTLPAPRDP